MQIALESGQEARIVQIDVIGLTFDRVKEYPWIGLTIRAFSIGSALCVLINK